MSRVFVVVMLVAAGCRDRGREPWKLHASSKGGYSVSMPGPPATTVDASTHRKEDVQPDGSLREGAPFVAEQARFDRGDDGVYTVRWYEVPISAELSERKFLERLIATKQLGPVVPRWIHLGPYLGIEYERIEGTEGVVLRSRMFVVEGRVFHLWADNWLERDDEASARRFIDSFDLALRPGLKVTYDDVVAVRAE